MQWCADKASQKFLATKQYLGVQLRLQWNIISIQRKAKGLVKRVRFIKVLLTSSTPISSLIRAAKLFIKRHIWLNLKAMDAFCLKVKAALITLLYYI